MPGESPIRANAIKKEQKGKRNSPGLRAGKGGGKNAEKPVGGKGKSITGVGKVTLTGQTSTGEGKKDRAKKKGDTCRVRTKTAQAAKKEQRIRPPKKKRLCTSEGPSLQTQPRNAKTRRAVCPTRKARVA